MEYYTYITENETIEDLVGAIKDIMNDKSIDKITSWQQIHDVLLVDGYFVNIGKKIIDNGILDFENWYIKIKRVIKDISYTDNTSDEIAINVWISYFESDKKEYDKISNIAYSKLSFLKRIFKGEKVLLACWIIPIVISLVLMLSPYGILFSIIAFSTPILFFAIIDCTDKKEYKIGEYIKLPFIMIGLMSTLFIVMSLFNAYIHHSKEILIYTMITELVVLLTAPIIGMNEEFFHTDYLKRKYKI